jgi:hypothetical protein
VGRKRERRMRGASRSAPMPEIDYKLFKEETNRKLIHSVAYGRSTCNAVVSVNGVMVSPALFLRRERLETKYD